MLVIWKVSNFRVFMKNLVIILRCLVIKVWRCLTHLDESSLLSILENKVDNSLRRAVMISCRLTSQFWFDRFGQLFAKFDSKIMR